MIGPEESRTETLLPWQARAAAHFFDSGPGTAIQIVAPAAAGKSTLARVIVGRTVAAGKGARVLVTCPTALADAWRHQLDGLSLDPPRILDVAAIREADERGEWPSGTIQIVPLDVLKRPGIAPFALRQRRDLLVTESIPPITRRRRELLGRAIDSGHFTRILVLTTRPVPIDGLPVFEVRRADVSDSTGKPLFGPPPQETPLPFRRSAEECARFNELHSVIDRLVDRLALPPLFREVTFAAAHSSPPAREETLARLSGGGRALRARAGLAGRDTHWSLHQAFPHTWDVVEPEEDRRPLPEIGVAELDEILAIAARLLAAAEDSPEEPKLDATQAVLGGTFAIDPEARVGLVTAFPTTALYLESLAPDLHVPLRALRSGQSFAERLATVAMHREAGGVLVVPDSAAQDLALEYVDEIVAFDLPLSAAEAERRLARFDRPGRRAPLRVRFLADETEGLSWRPVPPRPETV